MCLRRVEKESGVCCRHREVDTGLAKSPNHMYNVDKPYSNDGNEHRRPESDLRLAGVKHKLLRE